MRCTECSRVIKPVVALDIDGTLGDYHGHFERFAEQWLGWQRFGRRDYTGDIKYNVWFSEAFGIEIDTFRQIKLAYRQGGLKRSMPVFPEASDMTYRLHEAGAEVWLCTTRPYLKLDGIDPDTREWLSRNEIYYDHLMYGPNKYQRLAEQLDHGRVVGVLDDDYNHLIEAIELGYDSYLLRRPHNLSVGTAGVGRVVRDHQHAEEVLQRHIKEAKQQLQEVS